MLYHGNNDIILIEEHDYSTLDEILELDCFKDKIVLIDRWGTYCQPCLKEFNYAGELKEKYKDKPVEYLYLCEIERIDHKVRWKKIIQEKEIKGYHIPVYTIELAENIVDKHLSNPPEDKYKIPRYCIAKNGKIIISKVAYPSSKEKLYQQIDSVLNLE